MQSANAPRLEGPVRPLHPQVPEVLAGLVLPSRLEVLADREVPGRLLLCDPGGPCSPLAPCGPGGVSNTMGGDDVLALEGEHVNATREGVRVALADYEQIFRAKPSRRKKRSLRGPSSQGWRCPGVRSAVYSNARQSLLRLLYDGHPARR